jgi:CheY-like chemotaxis protein
MHVFNIVARRKKILIVEDNNDWRDLLAKFLNRFGYDAIEADSGREAIGKAFEMHPDLILMDIYLPDITGDEITARLKANPATRDIPVVITTALLERTARNHALHAGAAEILEKPFGIPTLREVLDRHLTADESKENCGRTHWSKSNTKRPT